ncbi:16S rRNA processing protein RimM [Tissierella creatinini]|nr:16S rRNA processing protein RimM [Tissierella creatinini]TJX69172.1 16S rRNA processing protein RimM [Soehngenia saccharolytica]
MEYTIVGKLINTHGIKGEVKVYPLTDDIERFSYLKSAYIGEGKLPVTIESVKYNKGMAILKFKGYDDINQILKFKDQYLYVDDDNKVVLPDNHFFISDLIGCKVYDMKNIFIGHIVDVLQGYSNDVYVIKDKEKSKDYLIPAVKAFIKEVNIEEKIIFIDPLEGMIE